MLCTGERAAMLAQVTPKQDPTKLMRGTHDCDAGGDVQVSEDAEPLHLVHCQPMADPARQEQPSSSSNSNDGIDKTVLLACTWPRSASSPQVLLLIVQATLVYAQVGD